MSFRTKTLGLTQEQKERGVIYSSQLVVTNNPLIDNDTVKEVLASDTDKYNKIALLKDVSFFKKMSRYMGWDVVNIVRR